jgi:hypothetical protein
MGSGDRGDCPPGNSLLFLSKWPDVDVVGVLISLTDDPAKLDGMHSVLKSTMVTLPSGAQVSIADAIIASMRGLGQTMTESPDNFDISSIKVDTILEYSGPEPNPVLQYRVHEARRHLKALQTVRYLASPYSSVLIIPLQWLDNNPRHPHHSRCIRILVQLASESSELPPDLCVSGVEKRGLKSGGTFSDVWDGIFHGRKVAIKVIRIHGQGDRKKLLHESRFDTQITRQNYLL